MRKCKEEKKARLDFSAWWLGLSFKHSCRLGWQFLDGQQRMSTWTNIRSYRSLPHFLIRSNPLLLVASTIDADLLRATLDFTLRDPGSPWRQATNPHPISQSVCNSCNTVQMQKKTKPINLVTIAMGRSNRCYYAINSCQSISYRNLKLQTDTIPFYWSCTQWFLEGKCRTIMKTWLIWPSNSWSARWVTQKLFLSLMMPSGFVVLTGVALIYYSKL